MGIYISCFEKKYSITATAHRQTTKKYPELGLDTENQNSLDFSIKLLSDNKANLKILSESYDGDNVIERYQYRYNLGY